MSGMPNETMNPINISTDISARFIRQYTRCACAIASVTGGGPARLEAGGGIEDMCLSTKCFEKRQSGSTSCAGWEYGLAIQKRLPETGSRSFKPDDTQARYSSQINALRRVDPG